jgi:hypothetical protein
LDRLPHRMAASERVIAGTAVRVLIRAYPIMDQSEAPYYPITVGALGPRKTTGITAGTTTGAVATMLNTRCADERIEMMIDGTGMVIPVVSTNPSECGKRFFGQLGGSEAPLAAAIRLGRTLLHKYAHARAHA